MVAGGGRWWQVVASGGKWWQVVASGSKWFRGDLSCNRAKTSDEMIGQVHNVMMKR